MAEGVVTSYRALCDITKEVVSWISISLYEEVSPSLSLSQVLYEGVVCSGPSADQSLRQCRSPLPLIGLMRGRLTDGQPRVADSDELSKDGKTEGQIDGRTDAVTCNKKKTCGF